MSISVENVTKTYGDQKALDKVGFKIGNGEIVGFLGPNGAGKSTMMKILTCFIPPTSGNAFVCGHDIHRDSIEIRKKVGYLPEHNPIHPDMYVKEYLHFVAGVHGLRNRTKLVAGMVDRVGLGREQHKLIGALSKGYRQRVGLAQALIHDPEVLILDEPTSGLDPNQLSDIRRLIKQLGREKTVMLSTHIMQEVEAICDRVIIVDKGVIVADDKAANLRQSRTNVIIHVEFDGPIEANKLRSIEGVSHVQRVSDNEWSIRSSVSEDVRPVVFELAVKEGLKVLSLNREEHGMEEVFKELTGSKSQT
jgi:ABC-2 type transport system ATP-binding protein